MTTASLIANKRAGAAALGRKGLERLADRLRSHGIEVVRRPGGRIGKQIRRSLEDAPDIVVVAGGDGTINAVANAHSGSGRPLGIVPLGTMNLLARDFGIPLAADAAVDVIASGRTAPVPAARIGGALFLHSAFIGLPVRIGTHREAQRRRLGMVEATRLAWHAFRSFARDPIIRVAAPSGRPRIEGRSIVVVVGAADDQLLPVPQRRPAPDADLEITAVRPGSRVAALRIVLRGLVGRLGEDSDVSTLSLREAIVLGPRRKMHVMLDGEKRLLPGRVRLSALAEAFQVFVPDPERLTGAAGSDATTIESETRAEAQP